MGDKIARTYQKPQHGIIKSYYEFTLIVNYERIINSVSRFSERLVSNSNILVT